MSSESISARYWRSLIGADPVLDASSINLPNASERASIGKLALWRFFDDGVGMISQGRTHLVSRLRFRSPRMSHPARRLEQKTYFGALLSGVQYMLDFRGSKLTREPPPDPGMAITEAFTEMLREIDEFLSADNGKSEE